ncbi:MAG: DUF4982 domain-containing protein [Lachnospiraceae bacterium]|nr:DUF4982 domain-containing protein [Lachnospiraceae bacterium]
MDKKIWNLNQGWKFALGDYEDAWYKGYDDIAWKEVMIPHDWAVEQPFSEEYSSGTGYLAGGIGWYRLSFQIPEEYRGKRISISFDGVYKNSQVWVNSYYFGKHPNGYTSFCYDISDMASFGTQKNVVCVKVTHTDIADSRWYTGSGITRKVSLIVEERLHPAEGGSYLVTKEAGLQQALVEVCQEVANDTDLIQNVEVETRILTKEGEAVLVLSQVQEIAPKTTICLKMEGMISKPRLWSTEQPYLYRMQTYYHTRGGESYLAEEKQVGIRRAVFDAERGFFLNDKPQKLKGVCLHHDAGCLGAAVTKEVWRRRLKTLKACGCNAIRCSHNPHMPELYDLCDEMGFVMMDEAFDEWENAKNKWSTGHNVYPPRHQGYFEDFPEWHERDLRAMIRRDRCHPSVILWSIGNEIDYPNDPYCHPMFETMTGNNDTDKPEAERQYDSNKPNAERLITIARELTAIAKSEDESRPVTMALAFPELTARLGIYDILDVVGYNYKEHLYEADHKSFPKKPLLGSENGHSYEAWMAVEENDYISGQFLWTGIDYLGEAHGWPIHGSGAGIMNCAGFPKSRYFRRKSFWSNEPVVYLATRKWDGKEEEWQDYRALWNYQEGERISVKCYSNLPEVRLLLNDREIGRQKGYHADGEYLFSVNYEAGRLIAQAFDTEGRLVQQGALYTTGKAKKLQCKVWQDDSETYIGAGYIYQIEVNLVDEEGRGVVRDDKNIQVEVSGSGILAGMENGDLSDNTPYAKPKRKTLDGRLVVYVKRTGNDPIKVVLSAEDLEKKEILTLS